MNIYKYFDDNDDVLLLNEQYVTPIYGDKGKIEREGVLYLTYRDNKDGVKKVKTIKNPMSSTFITKEEYRNSFKTQRYALPFDMVDRYDVPYAKMVKFIKNKLKEDGRDIEYLTMCDNAPKEIFKWRHSYFADYDICDFSVISWLLQNNQNIKNTNITSAFLDIEGDVYGLSSSEIDEANYPINAVSVVCPFDEFGRRYKHPKVFTFLLRNHIRYKQQEYFEKHLDKFIDECHDEFDDRYDRPQFIIRVFDDEIILLRSLFAILHKLKPDFINIWNMSYDIPTIIKRLENLGEDPKLYFCHPDFTEPFYRYNYDMIYKNDFKNRSDSFECSSYSRWLDQMLIYAGIRKGRSDYGGNSLDNVANIELGAEKRRYSQKTVSVLNGAIEEYWNFVKYSINDVLLQYGIDKKTGDLQSIFEQAIYGGTRITKALKQSVYLKNVFAIDYLAAEHIVPKNNNNVNYAMNRNEEIAVDRDEMELIGDGIEDYDDIKLAGALVGDPKLNGPYGVDILGTKSNALFINTMDMDYSSLYPNVKITSNIAEHTQYGRVIVNERMVNDENLDNNPKFMRGGKLIEDYETDDKCRSARWLGIKPTYEYINEYKNRRLLKAC